MNPGTYDALWLLAQHSRWRHLGDRFGGGTGLSMTDVLLLVAAVVLAIFGVFVLQRFAPHQHSGMYNDPRQLFRELCRSHGLGRSHRRLLKRLAAWRGLKHPAMVFVTPECFETVALPPELAGEAYAVGQLRMKLFQTV